MSRASVEVERRKTVNVDVQRRPTNIGVERRTTIPGARRTSTKIVFEKNPYYDPEDKCSCMKISGQLEGVKWPLYPHIYKPSPGYLYLDDWNEDPFIWLQYLTRTYGELPEDDVLMSKDTRYWEINDVQRYQLCDLHCEKVLFTCQYPNLYLPTSLGRHLWSLNKALKQPPQLYLKTFHSALLRTMQKIITYDIQIDRLIISDQWISIEKLDYFKRKKFLELLHNVISAQDNLQLVSFENLCCKRLEGIALIQQLACFNSITLKYLFLWRFVLPNENPILINYSYITGSGQYIPRPDLRETFLRALGELRNLRLLAIEYAHIADGSGGALLTLLPVICIAKFRLELMCREDQIPGKTDAALGVGGYEIPDSAWRRVATACPELYLFMAFFRVRDYDNLRRFLTPSIPLNEVHLQLGIDLTPTQRQDSDISCFFRHVDYRYGSTLVTLSIHQWRFATFPLRRVFECMPRLTNFIYIGRVRNEADLRTMLTIVAYGVCTRLKQLRILVQDDVNTKMHWKKVTKTIKEDYEDIMKLYKIKFCLGVYKQ